MLLGLISFFLNSPKKAKQKLHNLFSKSVVSVNFSKITAEKKYTDSYIIVVDSAANISKTYSYTKIEIQ